MPKYAIGVDFGTESGRALLVDVADGAKSPLPSTPTPTASSTNGCPAPASAWSRIGPCRTPTITSRSSSTPSRRCCKQSGVDAADVIGLGIDFTACTMLPTLATARRCASCRSTAAGRTPGSSCGSTTPPSQRPTSSTRSPATWAMFLDRYGGKISSEWFFPKVWQILDEDPEIYNAAERFIEAADWVVWQLTGEEKRNSCTAGYKAIWSKAEGFPPRNSSRPSTRGWKICRREDVRARSSRWAKRPAG